MARGVYASLGSLLILANEPLSLFRFKKNLRAFYFVHPNFRSKVRLKRRREAPAL